MIYLLLTISMNVIIFLAFRSFSRFKINTFPAIFINYLTCVLTGLIFQGNQGVVKTSHLNEPWFWASIMLGSFFIFTFFLMAKTTQVRGVAVATVASKMSLAIPVLFSLFIFQVGVDQLNILHYLGIILAFFAILLVTKKPKELRKGPFHWKMLALPLSVFFLGGLIDTSINYINLHLINEEQNNLFLIHNFFFAFLVGIIFAAIKKTRIRPKDIIGGIYLGIPNYFSVYFLLKTLSYYQNNGALVYPTINIGIIIFSTLLAIIFFQERLNKLNWLGVALATLVILLLSHKEILS